MFGLSDSASLFTQRERMILDAAASAMHVGPVKWRRRTVEFVHRGESRRVDARLIRKALTPHLKPDVACAAAVLGEVLGVAPPVEVLADNGRLRAMLRPRLLHPRELKGRRRSMCRREVFGGLLHALAIGPGPGAPLVTTALLDRWETTFEASAEIAAGNLYRKFRAERFLEVAESPGLLVLLHEDEQASAAALILDRLFPERSAPHGVVFAAPTADALLVLPVVEDGGAEGLAAMVQSGYSMAHGCDEPLSDQVFWMRGGDVMHLPMTTVEDRRSRRIHIEARGPLEDLLRILGVVE